MNHSISAPRGDDQPGADRRRTVLGRLSLALLAAGAVAFITPFVVEVLSPGFYHPVVSGLTFGIIVVGGLGAAVTGFMAGRRGLAATGLALGVLGVPAIAALAFAFPGLGSAL